MPHARPTHARPLALLATGVLALGLAGCGGDDEPMPASSTTSPAAAADRPVPTTWPLTGLPAPDGASLQRHPVLVLKMDNTVASAPQQGLADADLVVEELVEGGSTRLAVFYYETVPGKVGPVRSMRASDIGIVSPVAATVVTSGAASQTVARVNKADIDFFNESGPGFYREESRSAPYNLFTDMTKVAEAAKTRPGRPDDYLPFADGGGSQGPSGQPASSLTALFSGGHQTDWDFRDGRYVNTDSFAAEDDQFPADTVLVLRVKVGDAGYLDPAGNPVPETKLVGDGAAMLFHDGRLVRGEWSKAELDAPLELRTEAGPLEVPPGHTWIELVPAEAGDVTFE